jgi:Family of unknown function (DUF6159)
MSRIRNSWALMKASANVLRLDKELMVFPLLSGVATIIVSATFIAPAFAMGEGFDTISRLTEDGGYLGYVMGFLYYVALYTVIFFFNTALVGAAMIRLDGGDPTVGDGLTIAFRKLPAVLGYAVIASTVGMILRAIEERVGFLGRIIIGMLGVSWTLATYLTVPVLATKDIGAIDAVRESAGLFRKTWGEQMAANAGMGIAFFLLLVAMIGTFIPLAIFLGSINEALVLPMIISLGGGIVFLGLLSTTLQGIYAAALYRFATTGDPGVGFDAAAMQDAFRPRKKRW